MTKNSRKGTYASPDGSATWEYIAAMGCTCMTFCMGCASGWNSPGVPRLMAPDSPVPITPSEVSTMMGWVGLGIVLSPFIIILMTNKLERRQSLLAMTVPLIANWGLIVIADHPAYLFASRFLSGLIMGLGMCLAPMYLGEIASANLRGALGFIISSSMNGGMLLMFVIVPYISIRTSAYVGLTIAIISGIITWFIPESPYYLALNGKNDEAEAALEKLRGKPDVREELELILTTVRREVKTTNVGGEGGERRSVGKISSYKQLLSVTATRKGLCINLLFTIIIQFGGIITTAVYGQIIFEAMHSAVPAPICTIIFAGLQLICSILTTFVVDRLGRRPLIKYAGIVCGGCTLVVGVYFYLMEYRDMDVTRYSAVPLGAMFTFMVATSIGIIPVQMVIMSEIFATEVKSLANFLLGIIGGIMSTVSLIIYLNIAVTWGFGHSVPYVTFSAVTWTCVALILRMLPETKGKTLLEIQRELNGRR